MLLYILNGLYLCVWSILLVHCLQNHRFYSIFGKEWGAKVFWLLTFMFFNPILSLLYIIFVIILRPPLVSAKAIAGSGKEGSDVKLKIAYPIIAITCTCIVLYLFEMPRSGSKDQPFVILSSSEGTSTKPDSSLLKTGLNIGIIDAKNNIQTVSTNSAIDDMRINISNIMLMCKNDNQILDLIARKIQQSLVQLPYVDSVAYYSYGQPLKQGELLPDVFITLDMLKVNENKFLLGRKLEALIECKTGSSIFEDYSDSVNNTGNDPIVTFNIQSELRHASRTASIECPGTEYKNEVKNISNELTEAIKKQFQNMLNKYDDLPELPDILYGIYSEPPEFSFLNDGIEFLVSGSKLLKNNDTIWQFTDKRETEEALTAYNEELTSKGWTKESSGDSYLRMKKDNERIYIFRRHWRDLMTDNIVTSGSQKTALETPMIAHYSCFLTSEHMHQAMDMLLEGDIEIKTLLLFKHYFNAPQQQEHLCNIIKQNPIPSIDGYLLLGNYLADSGDIDKGREALMLARAMQLAEKEHNARSQEIENLAEKLGDENLIDVPLGEEPLRKTGFICTEEITEPILIERGLGEPVLFYKSFDDNQIHTIALCVIQPRDSSFMKSYRLLTIEKQGGNSSSSESDGRIEADGNWITDSYLHQWTNEDKPIQLQIESFGEERFLFTVKIGSV